MRGYLLLALLVFGVMVAAIGSSPTAPPASADEAAMRQATADAVARWQAMRFGMFVHWGPASLTGNEISWSRGGTTPGMIPIEEYDRLYLRFNPTKFDADAWAKTAKAAGAQYLVLTAKHADGFCLWPSQYTDYTIAKTPFKRDVVKELSTACRRHGIQFCTYYCITDWYHPDYPLGSPGGQVKKPNPDLPRYFAYVKNQTRELIEHYGPLGVMWFDWGDWVPEYRDRAYGDELYRYVKALQPSLVVNDRVQQPKTPSGDYSTSSTEGHIGGFNRNRPWETCMVIGGHWAWDPYAKTYYLTRKECLQWLLRVVGNDGNFLLNVGPNAEGCIEPEHVARLKEMGDWLAKYGEGVYGTRGGPFKAGRWGASTCKGNTIYLYIMEWPAEGPLQLPAISATITHFRALSGGRAVVTQRADGISVALPAEHRDPVVTVVALTVKSKAFDIPPVSALSFTQANALLPDAPPRSAAMAQHLTEGRMGLWHLDEGSGANAKDSSPHGRNGTILNALRWGEGKYGKALICGQYNALNVENVPRVQFKQGISIAAWVKAPFSWISICEQPGVCGLATGDGGIIGFSLDDSDGGHHQYNTFATLALTPDDWHHLAATYDGAVLRLYVDGEEQGEGLKAQFTLNNSDKPFRFGWNGSVSPGMLDEVMLYDRALTPEEVVALATAKTAEP